MQLNRETKKNPGTSQRAGPDRTPPNLRVPALSTAQSNVSPPQDLDPLCALDIVAANEQLILSSLHAEKLRERAAQHLDQVTRAAQRDALTNIPNRATMLDRLDHAIAVAKRDHSLIAVLFVDLDGFKQINDRCGHASGDEVLKAAAGAIQSALRRSDTISRHGGDEFLVLLPQISHTSAVALIAKKMLVAVTQPIVLGTETIHLSTSIGIAIFPDDGNDAATLIDCADKAMYRSKRRAPGHYAFHRAVLDRPDPVGLCERHADGRIDNTATADGQYDERRERRDRSARLQSKVVQGLLSPFTSVQESIELLRAVETQDPLLQVLIDRDIAHLSAPLYEPFAVRHADPAGFTRFETVKSDQFDTIDDEGLHHLVIEFNVSGRRGMHDPTSRSLTLKSFGLASGDRVNRLSYDKFQISQSGRIVRRV